MLRIECLGLAAIERYLRLFWTTDGATSKGRGVAKGPVSGKIL